MNTENVTTLKIHKLTQEQYDREYAAGRIDETAIYLTPDDRSYLDEYATKSYAETLAETVKSQPVSPSSKTKYYLAMSDNSSTETDILSKNAAINVNIQTGTASAAGVAQLVLGNGTSTGTAGNMTGYITLYAANGSDHRIYPSDNGVSCVHTLPPSGGTLVSGSNYTAVIPAATTSKAGLMSAADKQKLEEMVSGGESGASTITYVTAGKGLTGGGATGNVTLNIGAGSGITVTDDAISVNTNYVTSGKNYKVQVDSTSGGLFVNVPWTDNNTTYSEATTSAAGLLSAADKTKLNTLGTAAYANVDDLASAEHTHSYLALAGGALSGRVYSSVEVLADNPSFRNIKIVNSSYSITAGSTSIPSGEIWIRYQ